MADLTLLAIKSTPTRDLMEDALVLANDKNLTAYDACYAILAKRMDIPLITADEAMVKVIEWAIWLGDVNKWCGVDGNSDRISAEIRPFTLLQN